MRIVVADEHRLFRAGLSQLLSGHGMKVVGETDSGRECLELARRLHPSVLLVSLSLVDQSGLEVVYSLREAGLTMPVLALAPNWSKLSYHSVIRAGANAMVSKEHDPEQLIRAIERWVAGRASTRTLRQKDLYLSLRQLRILRKLTAGHTNEEIATGLNFSASTIKADLRELFEVFGTLDRSQLISSAAQQGFVSTGA